MIMTTHAVLGPGGIGGLVGGVLARAGHEVIFIVRPGRAEAQPPFVHVDSAIYGQFDAPVRAADRLDQPADVLWITCKATQLGAALTSIPADTVTRATIVPLLNGLDHVTTLRTVFPPDAVIVGMIRTESTLVAPGEIVHGGWHVANADSDDVTSLAPVELAGPGALRQRANAAAAELAEAGIPCRVRDSESQVIWQKLAVVAPYALATTAVAGSIGAVRSDAEVLAHLRGAAAEAVDVAIALGVELDREQILRSLERYPDSMRVSMERDLAAGRELELGNVADPVIREGRAHGLEMTSMQWLLARAKARAGTSPMRRKAEPVCE
jgi:2-dehydropantoate 2-reductase